MAKIKGWKKVDITHQPEPIRISWKENIWVSGKSKIEINRVGDTFEYIRTFLGVTQAYKIFKTKKQALDYAYKYMRSHPNG